MLALADVRRWDPAGVEDAFRRFGDAQGMLLGLDFELADSRPPQDWSGLAADRARAEHARLAERLRRVVAGVAAVRPTVADTADAITGLHEGIADAEALATANGFRIAPDGTVTDVAHTVVPADQAEDYQRGRQALQTELVDRLEQVLRRATEIDTQLADVLARAAAEQIDDGTGESLFGAAVTAHGAGGLTASAPPPDGSVADNAGWWDALSDAEQDDIIARHPDRVGNLDGIPAAVRDEANRTRLDAELSRIDAAITATEDRIAQAMRSGSFEDRLGLWQLHSQLAELREQRAPLAQVDTVLARPGDRQLLLLDLDHELPRAAVAVGDVDTADHVAVLTPGFNSNVADSLSGKDRDVSRLVEVTRDSLARAGRADETVAGVTWIGYDIPRWATTLDALKFWSDDDESVASPDAARAGGRDLARFLDGIDASRAADPHLTAIGHSYGSVTTGYALQHATGVDDAIVTGSPGIGTGALDELNVPAGRLGVLEADRDAIADLGRFGGDPNQLDGVVNLSTDDEPGLDLRGSTGHGQYMSPDSTSQYNIVHTVAGLPDHRIEGDNDGIGDRIRDPLGTLDRARDRAWEFGENLADGAGELGRNARDGLGEIIERIPDPRDLPNPLPGPIRLPFP